MDKIMKIGILGCSNITPVSVITPLRYIDNMKIFGIASSSVKRAEEYAEKYNIPNVFDSYSSLLESKDIDFVYIPLANDLHADWAVKSADAKKHILLEKPACINAEDFLKIKSACIDNNVYLLEAVMVQHHPWQEYISDLVKNETYGRLKSVKTQISFMPKDNFANNYRAKSKTGSGVFYDVGTYWLQFLQCIGNVAKASYSGCSSFKGPNGCDWTFKSNLTFNNGLKCDLTASFEKPYKASHELEFEHAIVTVPDFFRAKFGKVKISLNIKNLINNTTDKISFPPQNYYVNQLNFFSNVIDGKVENISLEKTYQRVEIMQKIYEAAKNKQEEGA